MPPDHATPEQMFMWIDDIQAEVQPQTATSPVASSRAQPQAVTSPVAHTPRPATGGADYDGSATGRPGAIGGPAAGGSATGGPGGRGQAHDGMDVEKEGKETSAQPQEGSGTGGRVEDR